MTDPIYVMPFTAQEEMKAQADFYEAFGRTMAQWARFESAMFYWFMAAIERPEALARAIFFSAKSFTGRRDMFNAAIPFAPFDDDTKAFMRAVSKKAKQYTLFRNRVAHGEPTFDVRRSSPTFKQYMLCEARITRSQLTVTPPDELTKVVVTNEHLGIAMQNLTELVRLMWDMHPQYRAGYPDAEPKAYRLLVLQLPNQAHSKEPARIPAEQQMQPDDPDE